MLLWVEADCEAGCSAAKCLGGIALPAGTELTVPEGWVSLMLEMVQLWCVKEGGETLLCLCACLVFWFFFFFFCTITVAFCHNQMPICVWEQVWPSGSQRHTTPTICPTFVRTSGGFLQLSSITPVWRVRWRACVRPRSVWVCISSVMHAGRLLQGGSNLCCHLCWQQPHPFSPPLCLPF